MGKHSRQPHSKTRARSSPLDIVMADDDKDDQLLVMLAAEEAGLNASFTFLDNGVELMTYLDQRADSANLPNLIVLDLRMPILDGHRTLEAIQNHSGLWHLPVIIFSSSVRHSDRSKSMEKGARWFETKPSEFSELVSVVSTFEQRASGKTNPALGAGLVTHNSDLSLGTSDLTFGDLRS